jgi:tetratricopeptide (TPR) repeat protein
MPHKKGKGKDKGKGQTAGVGGKEKELDLGGGGGAPPSFKGEASPAALTCGHCGQKDALKKCSRCKVVRYCSADCQKRAWKEHKPACKAAKSSRKPGFFTQTAKVFNRLDGAVNVTVQIEGTETIQRLLAQDRKDNQERECAVPGAAESSPKETVEVVQPSVDEMVNIAKKSERAEFEPTAECPICLDHFVGASTTLVLSCGHRFHGTCIAAQRKFGINEKCPCCRDPLPPSAAVFRAEGMKCLLKAEMKYTTETLTADGKLPDMLTVAEGANLSKEFNGVTLGKEALGQRIQQAQNAQALFRRALLEEPKFADLHMFLAQALNMTGDHVPAVAAYRDAAAIAGSVGSIHAGMGMAQQAMGDLEGAVSSFTRSAELDPGSAIAQLNLGAALVNAGEVDDGILALRRSISLQSGNYHAYCNLGVALELKDDVHGAIQAFQTSISIDPSSAAVHKHFGRVLTRCTLPEFGSCDFLDRAIASFNRAIELDPNGSIEMIQIVKDMQRQRKTAPQRLVIDAAKLLEQVMDMADTVQGAFARQRGELICQVCTRATALCEQAEALVLQALKAEPNHADAQTILHICEKTKLQMGVRKAAGLVVHALTMYNALAATGSKYDKATSRVITRAIALCEQAEALLSQALQAEPDHADALSSTGMCQKVKAVMTDCSAQGAGMMHYNEGVRLGAAGKLRKAVDAYRKAIEICPKIEIKQGYGRAHVNLGMALHAMGDSNGAKVPLLAAIELEPDWADPHVNLGVALEATDDDRGARASYEAAIALSTADEGGYDTRSGEFINVHVVAHYNLGNVLTKSVIQDFETTGSFKEPEFNKAVASYRRVIELDPKDTSAVQNLDYLLALDEQRLALDAAVAEKLKNVSPELLNNLDTKQLCETARVLHSMPPDQLCREMRSMFPQMASMSDDQIQEGATDNMENMLPDSLRAVGERVLDMLPVKQDQLKANTLNPEWVATHTEAADFDEEWLASTAEGAKGVRSSSKLPGGSQKKKNKKKKHKNKKK